MLGRLTASLIASASAMSCLSLYIGFDELGWHELDGVAQIHPAFSPSGVIHHKLPCQSGRAQDLRRILPSRSGATACAAPPYHAHPNREFETLGGFKNQLQQLMFSSDFSELYIMQELSVNLYRWSEPKRFSWSRIQIPCDNIQLFLGVNRQVCSFGQVLAQQSIRVLV